MSDATAFTKQLVSREQSAVYLSVSAQTISRLEKKGDLPSIKIGRFLRFRQEDLDTFLRGRMSLAKSKTSY